MCEMGPCAEVGISVFIPDSTLYKGCTIWDKQGAFQPLYDDPLPSAVYHPLFISIIQCHIQLVNMAPPVRTPRIYTISQTSTPQYIRGLDPLYNPRQVSL